MLAVDVLAQAIRVNPKTIAASALSERYLRALHAAGYRVIHRDEKLSDKDTTTAAVID